MGAVYAKGITQLGLQPGMSARGQGNLGPTRVGTQSDLPRLDLGAAHQVGWGRLATKIDWFREQAAACTRLAAAATDNRTKATLIDMALVWLRLAEREENRAEEPSSSEP
jgi:hypothetical protein